MEARGSGVQDFPQLHRNLRLHETPSQSNGKQKPYVYLWAFKGNFVLFLKIDSHCLA